ncbi:MAG: hypothetical protein K1X53_00190 [Candidatus Sumerlaeaceae bacterium]|nr:hypothetical protein [Candidatus Sumerlaeaceae bacterium]
MNYRTIALLALPVIASFCAVAAPDETAELADKLIRLSAKAKGFEATLNITEDRGSDKFEATSSLLVSRENGWKLQGSTGSGEHQVYNDFTVSYDYYPQDKTVFKVTATTPEMKLLFRRPVNEINPLASLDRKSLKYLGKETQDGEVLHHFEGTTTTQLLGTGDNFTRRMEAWIGDADGLPRKTMEFTDESTATTVYKGLKLNPDVRPGEFKFTPPASVKVIDVNKTQGGLNEAMEPLDDKPMKKPQTAPKAPPAK